MPSFSAVSVNVSGSNTIWTVRSKAQADRCRRVWRSWWGGLQPSTALETRCEKFLRPPGKGVKGVLQKRTLSIVSHRGEKGSRDTKAQSHCPGIGPHDRDPGLIQGFHSGFEETKAQNHWVTKDHLKLFRIVDKGLVCGQFVYSSFSTSSCVMWDFWDMRGSSSRLRQPLMIICIKLDASEAKTSQY